MVQLAASCSKGLWLERAEVRILFEQAGQVGTPTATYSLQGATTLCDNKNDDINPPSSPVQSICCASACAPENMTLMCNVR